MTTAPRPRQRCADRRSRPRHRGRAPSANGEPGNLDLEPADHCRRCGLAKGCAQDRLRRQQLPAAGEVLDGHKEHTDGVAGTATTSNAAASATTSQLRTRTSKTMRTALVNAGHAAVAEPAEVRRRGGRRGKPRCRSDTDRDRDRAAGRKMTAEAATVETSAEDRDADGRERAARRVDRGEVGGHALEELGEFGGVVFRERQRHTRERGPQIPGGDTTLTPRHCGEPLVGCDPPRPTIRGSEGGL